MTTARHSLPELGSPGFFGALYAYVSDALDGTVDKHVFTCILFCLLGRMHLPYGNHLVLRTRREEISNLRQRVLFMLSHIFGMTAVYYKCRSDTTPESLVAELLSQSSSDYDNTMETSGHARKGSISVSRTSSVGGRRRQGSVPNTLPNKARSQSPGVLPTGAAPVRLPQAIIISSTGRASHDTQECLGNILRTRTCINVTGRAFPEDLFVVLLNDIGDGRDKPHIMSSLLDQFCFGSYVDAAGSIQPSQPPRAPLLSSQFLHRLKYHEVPTVNPLLANYMNNLLTATTQHPLLDALLVGHHARRAFKHYVGVSAALFCNEDGRVQSQHVTQEDIDRVYIHAMGHRLRIRNVGEGVLSILDRTLAPLAPDKSREWKPGMKRGETVPQVLKEILAVV